MSDLMDLLGVFVLLCLALAAAGFWADWYCERRRDHDLLPPPDDPRLRNYHSMRDWRRRKAAARSRGMA